MSMQGICSEWGKSKGEMGKSGLEVGEQSSDIREANPWLRLTAVLAFAGQLTAREHY